MKTHLLAHGNILNVWEIEPRLLKQQIYLDDLDGKMPICIRFVHNPELVHAFVCTLGGAIYHLHRNSVCLFVFNVSLIVYQF
jgi:hypothetical protein